MTKRPRIITYEAAVRRGLTRYFTGQRCARGHLAERQTSNKNCIMCRRLALRRFRSSKKGRAAQRRYNQSTSGRARLRRYMHSAKYKAWRRKYRLTPQYRATERRYRQSGGYQAAQRRYQRSLKLRARAKRVSPKRIAKKRRPQGTTKYRARR